MKSKDGVEIKTEFVDKEGQIMLLKLSGFIDQSNVHLLEKTIMNGLDSECYKLIFDLGDLVYMSSAGWGVLVGEIKRFRQLGGDLKLVNMSSELYEVYQMLEFYHIIDEYSSLTDAVESFSKNNKPKSKSQKTTLSVSTNNKETLNKKAKETGTSEVDSVEKETDLDNKDKETKKKGNSNGRKKNSKSAKKDSKISKKESEINEPNDLTLNTEVEEMPTDQNGIVEKEIEFGDESPNNELSEVDTGEQRIDFNPMTIERSVDFKKLPVTEKIRTIVARFPHFSNRQIRKVLRHEDFGHVKIGYFKLRKVLRELELDTKEKRYRYYRSC
jgi:anti-sigma B factor antagonist